MHKEKVVILIEGQTGTGKSYLTSILENKNYHQLKSYSTRQPRYIGDKDHTYISEKDIDKYENKIAQTVINGIHYFSTKGQVEKCDMYLIDPDGIKELLKNMPEQKFAIVSVIAPKNMRRQRAIERGANPQKETEIFNLRTVDEETNKHFPEFEQDMAKCEKDPEQIKSLFGPNVVATKLILNNFLPKTIEIQAQTVEQFMTLDGCKEYYESRNKELEKSEETNSYEMEQEH